MVTQEETGPLKTRQNIHRWELLREDGQRKEYLKYGYNGQDIPGKFMKEGAWGEEVALPHTLDMGEGCSEHLDKGQERCRVEALERKGERWV